MNDTFQKIREKSLASNYIETERLVLKRWESNLYDAEGLYEFAKSLKVGPMAGWKPHEDMEESRLIIDQVFIPNICYKIIDKNNDNIVGNIGFEPDIHRPDVLSAEMGYSLSEDYWGKGYMVEAAKALIRTAFDYWKLDILSIQTNVNNIQSYRVIEKLGFSFEGIRRMSDYDYLGRPRDVKSFSMTKTEYQTLYK